MTDDEAHVPGPAGVEEPMGEPGGVGASDHLNGLGIDGQLGQRVIQHGDVVGGGAGAGVARS